MRVLMLRANLFRLVDLRAGLIHRGCWLLTVIMNDKPLRGLTGILECLCHNKRDVIAAVIHPIAIERLLRGARLAARSEELELAGDLRVFVRHDEKHTGHLAGLAFIEARDGAARYGARHEKGVSRAGHLEVRTVFSCASDF